MSQEPELRYWITYKGVRALREMEDRQARGFIDRGSWFVTAIVLVTLIAGLA